MASTSTTIELKWTKPLPIEEAVEGTLPATDVVYCITRKGDDGDHLHYVGKSNATMIKANLRKQMKPVEVKWKGDKMVSFAKVEHSQVGNMDPRKVMEDIKGALIYSGQPESNVQNKNFYRPRSPFFIIKNTGSKWTGFKSIIKTKDLYEQSEKELSKESSKEKK